MMTLSLTPESKGHKPWTLPEKLPWEIRDGVPVACVEHVFVFDGPATKVTGWLLSDDQGPVASGAVNMERSPVRGSKVRVKVELTTE